MGRGKKKKIIYIIGNAGSFIGLFSKQAFNKQANKQTEWFIGLKKHPNQTCAFVGAALLSPSCSVTREGRRSLWRSLYFPPLILSVCQADRQTDILSVRHTCNV